MMSGDANAHQLMMETLSRQLEHDRAELVTSLLELSCLFDGLARDNALHFARNPDDPKARESATSSLQRADAHRNAINEAIKRIHPFWPTTHKLAPILAGKVKEQS